MAKRLTRKEMELEIRNALELLKGEYLNDTTLNADKFINNEIRKLEDLNDSEKILLKDLIVCMMYKSTILDVRDVEIMAYIADKITDAGFASTDIDKIIKDALDSYDSAVAETYWKINNADNKK
jgi:hypothetical protein